MPGPFAPVLTEPGTANIQPVQTKLARPASPNNSFLTDAAGAIATGIDIFAKFKQQEDSRRIDAELEKLEQANVDRLIDGNVQSVISPEGDDEDIDEALPTEAQGELERLQRLRSAVKQGVISADESLIRMIAGIRKIKAQFPGHIAAIDARAVKKLGFRPSVAIVERALAPEKRAEARAAAQSDAAFKAGSFSMRVDGTVGPFLFPDGTIDHASTQAKGAAIIHAANEATALRGAAQAKSADLAFRRAQADFAGDARKAAQDLDVEQANSSKRGFDNGVDALLASQMEGSLPMLERIGADGTPEEKEQALQRMQTIIRQTLDGLRKEYNWATMNQKTRDDVIGYINPRIEQLMAPFVNKDYGTMLAGARLLSAKKAWAGLTLARNPELFGYMALGSFGSDMLKTVMALEPGRMTSILAQIKQFGDDLSAQDIATLVRKVISDPNALDRMTPSEAKVSLQILRKGVDTWARDRSQSMDEKSAIGYFNGMHNLAKGAATLPTAEDKQEAAAFFSDQAHLDRVKELEKLNPGMAQVIGTDAVFVINESISATGRELRNRPGFGDTWTVEFDSSVGEFVPKQLKEFAAEVVIGRGTLPVDPILGNTLRSQLKEAASIALGLNSGLRAVEAYQHLDASIANMTRLQAREAVAASAFLGNVQSSTSSFKNDEEKAKVQQQLDNRSKSVKNSLVGDLQGSQEDRSPQNQAAFIAAQRGSPSPQAKVVRRRYDPATDTFKPVE